MNVLQLLDLLITTSLHDRAVAALHTARALKARLPTPESLTDQASRLVGSLLQAAGESLPGEKLAVILDCFDWRGTCVTVKAAATAAPRCLLKRLQVTASELMADAVSPYSRARSAGDRASTTSAPASSPLFATWTAPPYRGSRRDN